MSKALAPSVTVRDSKGRKFVTIVEAAYDKAGLSEEEAQRINDTPGLADLVGNFITENRRPNHFVKEEVASTYGYRSGYQSNPTLEKNLRDLEREFQVLRASFPELAHSDYDHQYVDRIRRGEVRLPKGAERWMLIPRWQMIAPTYGEEIQRVFDPIKLTRNGKFTNYRESQLGPEYLRQHERSVRMLEQSGKSQSGDTQIVAVQLGLHHRGKSVRKAREKFVQNEFGLGAFAVGIILLMHPERLAHRDDLWIDCAGDEFSPFADGIFSFAPFFSFSDGRVKFGTHFVGDASDGYGSASAFLP